MVIRLNLITGGETMVIMILSAVKEWLAKNNKSGEFIWKELAGDFGLGVTRFEKKDDYFTPEQFEKLFSVTCKKLSLTREAFDDTFTKYWSQDILPKYCQYYLAHSDSLIVFINNIIKLNNQVCEYFPDNPNLWKIDIQELDSFTYQLNYSSDKALAEFIKIVSIGKARFNCPVAINKTKMFSAEMKL
jgi:hypothetical protein